MFAFAQPRFWALFFTEFCCSHCGSRDGYVSRSRNFFEKYALGSLHLRPVRCGDCYRRSWRPLGVRLLPRMDAMQFDAEAMVASAKAEERKETQKETQDPREERQRIA
ncbi:MAG: hypothetical protein WA628_06870 [Terriglobales bacterium]